MPDFSGRDLLREWEKGMQAMVDAATSLTGRPELPSQLLEPMQRQLELVQQVVERERELQRDLTARLLGPIDAIFDLLEQSGAAMSRQAEALAAAGRALEETSTLMKGQAELFEQTVSTLRRPTDLAKSVAGVAPEKAKRTRRRAS